MRRLLLLAIVPVLTGCRSYTPVPAPLTPLNLRDVRHIRVSVRGEGLIDIWYPYLSGDTALAGLTSNHVSDRYGSD